MLKAHSLCNGALVVHDIYNLAQVMEYSLVAQNKIKARWQHNRGVVRAKVQTKQAFTVYPHHLELALGQ